MVKHVNMQEPDRLECKSFMRSTKDAFTAMSTYFPNLTIPRLTLSLFYMIILDVLVGHQCYLIVSSQLIYFSEASAV